MVSVEMPVTTEDDPSSFAFKETFGRFVVRVKIQSRRLQNRSQE
jgi:hypothetical protein